MDKSCVTSQDVKELVHTLKCINEKLGAIAIALERMGGGNACTNGMSVLEAASLSLKETMESGFNSVCGALEELKEEQ